MTDKPKPQSTIDRKKREALALKANMKRRKEQAKLGRDLDVENAAQSPENPKTN